MCGSSLVAPATVDAEELGSRAARSSSGWTPDGPSSERAAAIVAFAEEAKRSGYADPAAVDGYLREGSNAMLDRDYAAAVQIFRALLVPISVGDIDLGQDEMVKGNRVVVGFAMEDHDHRVNAEKKLQRKHCDAIVLNGIENVAGDDAEIKILLADRGWQTSIGGSKVALAQVVVNLVENLLDKTA